MTGVMAMHYTLQLLMASHIPVACTTWFLPNLLGASEGREWGGGWGYVIEQVTY